MMVRWSGEVQVSIRWMSGERQISIWAWHWWTWNLSLFGFDLIWAWTLDCDLASGLSIVILKGTNRQNYLNFLKTREQNIFIHSSLVNAVLVTEICGCNCWKMTKFWDHPPFSTHFFYIKMAQNGQKWILNITLKNVLFLFLKPFF